MNLSRVSQKGAAMTDVPRIKGLYHYAYPCRDAEETRHFYEDILGMRLVHVVTADHVSTGQTTSFAHVFFEMTDGSCIAFFDLGDNIKAEPSPNTPAWVNHIAFKVKDADALNAMKARLEANKIEVVGITDHEFVHSIYFFDPNGVRLELTAQLADEFQMLQESKTAHARLNEWTARKEQWRKDRAEGKSAAPLKPQQNDRPEFAKK